MRMEDTSGSPTVQPHFAHQCGAGKTCQLQGISSLYLFVGHVQLCKHPNAGLSIHFSQNPPLGDCLASALTISTQLLINREPYHWNCIAKDDLMQPLHGGRTRNLNAVRTC